MAIMLLVFGVAYLSASIMALFIDVKSQIYRFFSLYCFGIFLTLVFYYIYISNVVVIDSFKIIIYIIQLIVFSTSILFFKSYCRDESPRKKPLLSLVSINLLILVVLIIGQKQINYIVLFLTIPCYFYSIILFIGNISQVNRSERKGFIPTSCVIILPLTASVLAQINLLAYDVVKLTFLPSILCMIGIFIYFINLNYTGIINHKITVVVTPINQRLNISLTEREIEILKYFDEGLSNKTVSEQLYLSESTVRNHITNINRKLSTKNKIEALKKAKKLNIV